MAFLSAKNCRSVQMPETNLMSWLSVYFLMGVSILVIVGSTTVNEQSLTAGSTSDLGTFVSGVQFWSIPPALPRDKRSSAIACGRNLAAMLSMVCRGRYNTKETGRRRRRRFANLDNGIHSVEFEPTIQAKSQNEEGGSGEPKEEFQDQWTTSAPIILHRRNEAAEAVGAYSQCCLKQCSMREMAEYCHPEIRKTVYGHFFKT